MQRRLKLSRLKSQGVEVFELGVFLSFEFVFELFKLFIELIAMKIDGSLNIKYYKSEKYGFKIIKFI